MTNGEKFKELFDSKRNAINALKEVKKYKEAKRKYKEVIKNKVLRQVYAVDIFY